MKYLKNNYYLIFLLLFVVISRLPMLIDQMIPFQFDHGKDAIGTFHMWQTLSPKLIGPWTSIPGLFFGPAWYYMLLPGMIVSGGAPIASVVMMLLLGLMTIVILYVYFGKFEATLFATSALLYTITTSAWNPFPMVLVSVVILAVLRHVEKKKKITRTTAGLLGFFAALGFHFSTAFAVFYPIVIVASLLLKRTKVDFKAVGVGIVAFIVPFLPQLLFEVKHGFIEVKAVLAYLHAGDSAPASSNKLLQVLSITWGEMRGVLFPGTYFQQNWVNNLDLWILIALFFVAVYFFIKRYRKETHYLLLDAALWFTIPIVGFTFLHFNIWYILPLLAFSFILVGEVFASAPKKLTYLFLALCFVASLSKVYFYLTLDRQNLLQSPAFLPNKIKAIEYIYSQADGQPFASYQYMPDIYDFPYQYLYFRRALQGKSLPTEFSYKPGEVTYIPEKPELLARFRNQETDGSPQKIFYIVEKSDNPALLEQWWSQQKYGTITQEQKISEGITVYTATPEGQK